MQNLMLADDLFEGLHSGLKKNTIRHGHRDIQSGRVLRFDSTGGTQEPFYVYVREIEHKTAAELTDEDARNDGAENAEILLEAMKRFYPDITPESPVTVIRFG